MYILLFFMVICCTEALYCKQCGIVMSAKHNKSSERCLEGQTKEMPCPNANHTHCVINFFRDLYENTILILWRKCGTKKDIMPCAIFDVSPHMGKNNSSDYLLSLSTNRQPNKLKTDTSGMDSWKPLEVPVTPRVGLIQVCSAEAKDCDTKQCLVVNGFATSGHKYISNSYFVELIFIHFLVYYMIL